MKRIGIIFNPGKARAQTEIKKLTGWLRARGCTAVIVTPSGKKIPKLDCALSLGGDGTMLRASRLLAPLDVPLIGINLGSLGFLAETNPDDAYGFLSEVLAGKYRMEERIMLSVTLHSGRKTTRQIALNDAVIHSGKTNRIVTIAARVNDEFLADYIGDGLIVATPTGSTAYSLAASGPIAHPPLKVFVMTPICPHTLTQRPLIISSEHTLKLTAASRSTTEKPTLTIDGQITFTVANRDHVTITKAEKPLLLITNPRQQYLNVLRTKLKWGERGNSSSVEK